MPTRPENNARTLGIIGAFTSSVFMGSSASATNWYVVAIMSSPSRPTPRAMVVDRGHRGWRRVKLR
jgi:hypothetical protein